MGNGIAYKYTRAASNAAGRSLTLGQRCLTTTIRTSTPGSVRRSRIKNNGNNESGKTVRRLSVWGNEYPGAYEIRRSGCYAFIRTRSSRQVWGEIVQVAVDALENISCTQDCQMRFPPFPSVRTAMVYYIMPDGRCGIIRGHTGTKKEKEADAGCISSSGTV